MIDFMKRMFGKKTQGSGNTAKERLQLVLIHDRANLSASFLSKVKEDVLHVVSRYAEIDEQLVEVNLEQRGRAVALTADIPIRRMKESCGESRTCETK